MTSTTGNTPIVHPATTIDPTQPADNQKDLTVRTAHLAQVVGEVFTNFDTRMQTLTADLDPENVRTAGAMALETGMYANNLAKILDDLIGVVHELTVQPPATPQTPPLTNVNQ